MPSLIRLIIILLFLAGIAYGAMFALVALVQPEQREITVRIPARDLFGEETVRIPIGGTETTDEETADETETPDDAETGQ